MEVLHLQFIQQETHSQIDQQKPNELQLAHSQQSGEFLCESLGKFKTPQLAMTNTLKEWTPTTVVIGKQ